MRALPWSWTHFFKIWKQRNVPNATERRALSITLNDQSTKIERGKITVLWNYRNAKLAPSVFQTAFSRLEVMKFFLKSIDSRTLVSAGHSELLLSFPNFGKSGWLHRDSASGASRAGGCKRDFRVNDRRKMERREVPFPRRESTLREYYGQIEKRGAASASDLEFLHTHILRC